MGCDVSDINNDAWPDIFTVDMLPEDNQRQKLLYGPENYEHYALMVLNGFYFQNMRNMLHLNNGNGTYSEIGQYSGISKTDWSWAPLFADYDNDGWKDLFITNGYYRDYTNRDFLKYKGDYYFQKSKAKEKADTFHLVSTMTSTPVHDYMYRNNGDLTFTDESATWGFKENNFSNGAAYADLDNDGDLDIVVNHQNAVASVFRNNTRERFPEKNFLQITLQGSGKNTNAIGAKIQVYTNKKVQYYEHISTRGFQSSVSNRIHIGLEKNQSVDSVLISWPTGRVSALRDVKANQHLKLAESEGKDKTILAPAAQLALFSRVDPIIDYTHVEEGFNDFKRQPLLLTMLTTCGPIMAVADVNNDGRSDVFIGGAQGTPGKIFLQNNTGTFNESVTDFNKDFTDADALFADIDGDKDLDLYIVSGGYNDYGENDKALQDRIYLNDGKGKFTLATGHLPNINGSKSCISAKDFDHDGDLDLFIGGRVIPGKYPVAPESFVLRNNAGHFENITSSIAPVLPRIGMVTDAKWLDVNGDRWEDLVVMGEFMAIEVFVNESGKKLERATDRFFATPLLGLWSRMTVHDFDKDGDDDIIAGNLGLNTQLRASAKEPISLVFKDFDNNGSVDPILTQYIQGKSYPFPSRDELLDQMYSMRSKYTNYASYADAQLNNVFSSNDLKGATELKATTLETIYLENTGHGFVRHDLPAEAQFAPSMRSPCWITTKMEIPT